MTMSVKSAVVGTALCLLFTLPSARADIVSIDTPSGCVCSGFAVAPDLQAGTYAIAGYCNFTTQTGTDSDNVNILVYELTTGNLVASANVSVGRPPMQNRCRYSGSITFPNYGLDAQGNPIKNSYRIVVQPRVGSTYNTAKNEANDKGYIRTHGY